MTLVDPTGGLGYTFGQKLPSTHMTTIAGNQPKAVDGNGGGTWAPGAPIILNGASALQLGAKLNYTSRSVVRMQSLNPQARAADWTWALGATGVVWQNANAAAASKMQAQLAQIAHNSVVTGIRAFYKGAAGHVGLPASMPKFTVYRVDSSNTYTGVAGTTTDPSATVAAFQAAHSITLSVGGGSFTADLTQYNYVMVVEPESGMNALAGAQYLGAEVTMTITEQAEV